MGADEELSGEEAEFMRALTRVLVYVPRVFETDLGREAGLAPNEYFTLMYLSETPDGCLRMGEVAAKTALTLGAVTRVVTLLERKGLVERRRSPDDGRSTLATLTDAGRRRLEELRPAQVRSVRHRIFDKLTDVDLRPITTALARMSHDD